MPHQLEIISTICFAVAVLHTFSVKFFQRIAHRYPEGSVLENLFHLLGEVEVVFGLWSLVYIVALAILSTNSAAVSYLESLNFTEPSFVFVIMAICSTKPILQTASRLIEIISKLIPINSNLAFYISCLIVGPLLGSFITEPAAMTVTALILLERFYKKNISTSFKYATIGALFVNVSIGGTLTHFAAPPVLMVAHKWGWDTPFMLTHFGWKAALAVIVSATITAFRFRKELVMLQSDVKSATNKTNPLWVNGIHLLLLAGVITYSHHTVIFVGIFLLFLGLCHVMREYHNNLSLREPLMVGFFLAGLVVIGTPQRWWLEPLLQSMNEFTLYISATALTAITDNAALTYLGSQVSNLSETSKYALVAGSVVGGGLTVIANAPNPAGYGILNASFGKDGISAKSLFLAALPHTLIALIFFWYL